jgi:hypothetical protein
VSSSGSEQGPVNIARNPWVPSKEGNFLTRWVTIGFSRAVLHVLGESVTNMAQNGNVTFGMHLLSV